MKNQIFYVTLVSLITLLFVYAIGIYLAFAIFIVGTAYGLNLEVEWRWKLKNLKINMVEI